MKVFSMEKIKKTQGDKTIFNDIAFSIGEGDKIGVLGINGTGKSTLLNIISGIEDYDAGEKDHPNDYSISYLEQNPEFDDTLTIMEYLYASDSPVFTLIKNYEKTLLALQENSQDIEVQDRLMDMQQKMDEMNAWETSADAQTFLTKLGLPDFTRPMSVLSGGQKKRAALAKTLIETPDLLILDEPTNHLDFESIKWLEEYLAKYQGSVLFVTHDRYFLDNVAKKIWEIENGNLFEYKGNYADYLEAKAIREENESQDRSKKENLFKAELAWIRKGAKARSTKQKARIQRFETLEEKVKNKTKQESLEIGLSGTRLGKKVIELKEISKSFTAEPLIESFSFLFKPGDRIGIVGRNGTGKSTLLNILAGTIPIDSGEIEIGQTVKIGYYTQVNEEIDQGLRMIEYIRKTADSIKLKDGSIVTAAQMLEKFLFPLNSHGTLIRKLSGGEQRRLFLLKILMSAPNVLLLDEPTNDLDTQTLTVLEHYLESFPGVVVTVSHDRYFLDKTCKHLFVFRARGTIDFYYGGYTDFLEDEKVEKVPVEVKPPVVQERTEKKKKITYAEKLEWETIETDMEKIEERLGTIKKEMAVAGSDFEKIHQLLEEEENLNKKLEYTMERWEYLTEKQGE